MSSVVQQDWAHQAREFRIGRDKRSRILIWPMRSGKSKACVDKAVYQYRQHRIEGVVLIAPNGVHLNWAMNEIPKWTPPGVPFRAFAWETPKRGTVEKDLEFRRMLTFKGLKWFCINMEALAHPDNVRAIKHFLAACHRKFMMVISEAHHFGHAGAKRTHKARNLSLHADFVQLETGTPILTGPLRAFSIFDMLAPGCLGFRTYGDFKEYYVAEWHESRPGDRRKYKKPKTYRNLEELRKHVSVWSSVVLREELRDMPPLIRTERPVVMTPPCRAAYLEMVTRHLAEIGDDLVTVRDPGPRMMKLQQILHGYIKDPETGRIIEIDRDAAIYEAAREQIEGTFPGKSLVWCRYKEDIRRLRKNLPSSLGVLEYHGDMSAREREANRMRFLNEAKWGVIIGTPDTGGEGLDFSAADLVLFFSIPPNARMIRQAEERATLMGGKSVAVTRMRHYGTVDDRMWQIVENNTELAEQITGRELRDMLLATDC